MNYQFKNNKSFNTQQELQQTTNKSFNINENYNFNIATTGERVFRGTTAPFQRTRGGHARHLPYYKAMAVPSASTC